VRAFAAGDPAGFSVKIGRAGGRYPSGRSMFQGGIPMTRHLFAAAAIAGAAVFSGAGSADAQAPNPGQQAYGRQWAYSAATTDWNRFYHYPYVFYPQNYYADGYMRSANDLYYRYPQEMRVPVYNRDWQNYYPKARRYHQGHHFNLDVF
jgi:hypothetical protein